MEAEMGVVPLDEDKLSDMGRQIREGAHDLGYTFELMPKCRGPGGMHGVWQLHVRLRASREVDRRATARRSSRAWSRGPLRHQGRSRRESNGHVTGIEGAGPDGRFEARADTVVLAAGGFGTAPILLNSGIEGAGEHLFIDLLVNVYAASDEPLRSVEPQMSLVDTELHEERGFLLSPFMAYSKPTRTIEAGPPRAPARCATRSA